MIRFALPGRTFQMVAAGMIGLACVASGESAEAVVISVEASAIGSSSPATIPNATSGQTIQNGDFLILDTGRANRTLGNGIDEDNIWNFDFSDDPNISIFPAGRLTQAHLTLSLVRGNFGSFQTDIFRPITLTNDVQVGIFPGALDIPVGETGTLELDLLGFGFKSNDLLAVLSNSDSEFIQFFDDPTMGFEIQNAPNTIPFYFADDAIVFAASLRLVSDSAVAPVPAPSTIALASLGLVALGVTARRCGELVQQSLAC